VPSFTLRALLERIPPRVIPWQYVDLLETDPARRVKLKIAYEGPRQAAPADIADIVEDLAPAEREAVFETIDEEVAAETLEEIDPDVQVSIVESLDKDAPPTSSRKWIPTRRPTCSASCRGALGRDSQGDAARGAAGSHAAPRVRRAHGRRPDDDGVHRGAGDRGRRRRDRGAEAFEGSREALATIYLTGRRTARRRVPLVKIAISSPAVQLSQLSEPYVACAPDTPQDEVARSSTSTT
jgi:hypothetical protein